MVVRCPGISDGQEVLERVLEGGLAVDGLSHLEAVDNSAGSKLTVHLYCSLEDKPKAA
jgi:hypothetical protein